MATNNTLPRKEYKTRKDLEILFAWTLFYRDNNQPIAYKKCQKQADDLIAKLYPDNKK